MLGFADDPPADLQHGIAADDDQVGIRLALGPRHGVGHVRGLGTCERLHLLGRSRLGARVGGQCAQDRVLIDVGDPHERLDAGGAQGGQTAGGLRGQKDHALSLDDRRGGPAALRAGRVRLLQ